MFRPIGFDFKGDPETSSNPKFHFLHDTTRSKTLKIRNCDVGEVRLYLWIPVYLLRGNGHLDVFDYRRIPQFSYVHPSRVYV